MSTCAFIAAYCSTNQCEIFPTEDKSGMIAYIPTKENAESTVELGGVTDFTKAEIVARQLGLDPQWK